MVNGEWSIVNKKAMVRALRVPQGANHGFKLITYYS